MWVGRFERVQASSPLAAPSERSGAVGSVLGSDPEGQWIQFVSVICLPSGWQASALGGLGADLWGHLPVHLERAWVLQHVWA